MTTKVYIDSVPYELTKEFNGSWSMPEFPFDVRVPERWSNRKGGEYCGLNQFQIYQNDDLSLSIYCSEKYDDDMFIDEFLAAISDNYDAMKEIGWEALAQYE